jgi:hypothetical protein
MHRGEHNNEKTRARKEKKEAAEVQDCENLTHAEKIERLTR